MKRLFILLAFLFSAIISFAQFPISQSQGSPSTQVYSRGGYGVDSGFVYRTNYADTAAANLGFLDNIPGIVIRTGSTLWLRNQAATAWVEIGSGAVVTPTLQQVLDAGSTFNKNNSIDFDQSFSLTFTNVPEFIIEGSGAFASTKFLDLNGGGGFVRLGRSNEPYFEGSDSARIVGLTKSNDTTRKILTISPTGGLTFANWSNGGGGSQTDSLFGVQDNRAVANRYFSVAEVPEFIIDSVGDNFLIQGHNGAEQFGIQFTTNLGLSQMFSGDNVFQVDEDSARLLQSNSSADISGFNLLARNPVSGGLVDYTGAFINEFIDSLELDTLVNRTLINAYGNSLTLNTTGIIPYTQWLSQISSRVVFNKGVAGETAAQIRDRFLADTSDWKNATIIWSGRNNMAGGYTTQPVIDAIDAMEAKLVAAGNVNWAVLDILPGTGEIIGTPAYDSIIRLNNRIRTEYGTHASNLLAFLLTKGDGSVQDNTDIANGIVPSSLRIDAIHLTSQGYVWVAHYIDSFYRHILYNTDYEDKAISPQMAASFTQGQFSSINVKDSGDIRVNNIPVAYIPYDYAFGTTQRYMLILGDGGRKLTTGATFNTIVGRNSFLNATSASSNTIGGSRSANAMTTGLRNTGWGEAVYFNCTTCSDNTAIGEQSMLGGAASGFLRNTAVGAQALRALTSGNDNTAVGQIVLQNNTTGVQNVGVGRASLNVNVSGGNATAVGYASQQQTTAGRNSSLGSFSLNNTTSGVDNVTAGRLTMFANQTGSKNTSIGDSSLFGQNAAGISFSHNTTLGNSTGLNVRGSADSNTFIGSHAVIDTFTGDHNLVIGPYIDMPAENLTDFGSIGNVIFFRNGNNAGFGTGTTIGTNNVGIQTNDPREVLDVNGIISVRNVPATTDLDSALTMTDGRVNSIDLSNRFWNLTGNSAAAGASTGSFLGTTNDVSLRFRTNGIQRAVLDSVGNLSLGTAPFTGVRYYSAGTVANGLAAMLLANSLTADANTDPTGLGVSVQFTEAGSGTHNIITGVSIGEPVINAGAATVTNTASLYITNSATATVTGNNYSFWVDNGLVRFDGNLMVPPLVSSAGTLTLNSNSQYVFTGTTATHTLPAITGNVGMKIGIKNRGSGNVTVDVTGGPSEIYTTSAVASVIIAAGGYAEFLNDGTFWVRQTNN
jgi:hypothetical protein